MDKEGLGRTVGGMDQQDGAKRAWRWYLGIGKWAMRPHAPAHGTQAVEEEWRVDSCFLAGFPLTCRSASCPSESEVSGWRRASRKKSPMAAVVVEGS